MKAYIFITVLGLSSLVGCTGTAQSEPDTDPAEQLALAMAGTYDRASTDTEEPLRDRRIRIPSLGDGEWIYYQVNEGEDLQTVYRQRVLHLQSQADGSVTQTAYPLAQPEPFQAMDAPLDTITRDDFSDAMTPGCEMVWRTTEDGWAGRVDPESCVIFSTRRQMDIRIGSRAELSGNRLRQGEAGYLLDNTQLWGSEPGEWLTLYRVESER